MNRLNLIYQKSVDQARELFSAVADDAFYSIPMDYYTLILEAVKLKKNPEQGDIDEVSHHQYRDLLVVGHCRSLLTIPNIAVCGFPEETTALCRQAFERVCNMLWLADDQKRFMKWATHSVESDWVRVKNRYEQGLPMLFRRMVERGLLLASDEAEAVKNHQEIMSDAYTTLSAFAHGNPSRTRGMSQTKTDGQDIMTPGPRMDGYSLSTCIAAMQHLCVLSTIVAQLYATYQLDDDNALRCVNFTYEILNKQREVWKDLPENAEESNALLATLLSYI